MAYLAHFRPFNVTLSKGVDSCDAHGDIMYSVLDGPNDMCYILSDNFPGTNTDDSTMATLISTDFTIGQLDP